jgi:cyclase
MITKRIIPCLNIRDGQVVTSGRGYETLAMSPMDLAKAYAADGADELLLYDITANAEDKTIFTDVVKSITRSVFVPLTVGGRIRSTADFERVLACGADKVSVNSGAIKTASFIEEAAKKYGNQCVVLAVNVKKVGEEYHVFSHGGARDTGMEAVEWIKRCVGNGAGEVVVNSMGAVGVKGGYDVALLKKVCEAVEVPVIASGGAGNNADFLRLFTEIPDIDAGLAATAFHCGEINIKSLKETLIENGINVRI